jgi:hypothetical protein
MRKFYRLYEVIVSATAKDSWEAGGRSDKGLIFRDASPHRIPAEQVERLSGGGK